MWKWQSQSSGLHSPSLEPISRYKTNKFFQLAVDAVALMRAKGTLWHLQVFSCPADRASLWLLFYALSTTSFSDSWACLQNSKALFIQSSFFPVLSREWLAAFHYLQLTHGAGKSLMQWSACWQFCGFIQTSGWPSHTGIQTTILSAFFCGSQSLCIEVH